MVASSLCIAVLLSTVPGVFGVNQHDPLVIGQTFIAGSIDPTVGSTGWALTSHGISEKLFTVDSEGNIVGQVAKSVRKLETLKWEVNLKSDYKFSDGTVVTAQHVADCLTQLNKENSNAQASLGMMTVTAVDDLTLQIQSERATLVMEVALAAWVFTIYMQKGGQFLFTGPYAVETFVQGDKIDLIPNPHYPRASERPLLVIKKFAGGEALASALEANQVDMAFHLPIDSLSKLRQTPGVTIKSFPVGYQYMMFYNTRRSHLSDVKVRKALDIALDRQELTQDLQGGRATRSFFPEHTPYYLTDSQLYADKAEAATLLDEAGWVKNANGIREKGGVPLTLNLVAYPQRPGLVSIQPAINRTFVALGITVNTKVTSASSWDELDTITAAKDFDLLFWAQHTLPAGDPQWFLNAFFRTDSGNNFAGLASANVDGLLDSLSLADAGATRVAAAADVHNAILGQVPVSMLMTPSWHVGVRSRMSKYEPWGSDYYIVHAEYGLSAPQTSTPGPIETDVSGSSLVMLRGFSVASLLCLGLLF